MLYLILGCLAAFGTVVDATASWYSIDHLGIAAEGNPLLNGLATHIGFAGTMTVRAVVGVGLVGLLYWFASRSKRPQATKLARIGLWASAIILNALAVYHVVGILLYG